MQSGSIASKRRDALSEPVCVELARGKTAYLKIDALVVADGVCAVGGWQSEPFALGIEADGAELPILQYDRFLRRDVNLFLGTDLSVKHGFGIAFQFCANAHYRLAAGDELLPLDLKCASSDAKAKANVFGNLLMAFLRSRQNAAQTWQDAVERGASPLKCGIDHAFRWPDPGLGSPVFVTGWLAVPTEAVIVIGDGAQYYQPQLHFFTRADIAKEYDVLFGEGGRISGFACSLKNYPAYSATIAFYAELNGARAKLAELKIVNFYGYRALLKAIFEIDFLQTEMAAIYGEALIPLLTEIQRKRVKAIMANAPVSGQIGACATAPALSLVIPLYGTLGSLAKQMQGFAGDSLFQNQAELIYVIADPDLYDEFQQEIFNLNSTYGVACRWLYARASLGYAEACNLGASQAQGGIFVFVNSDVYPVCPGWLREFCALFAREPDAGLAGCHLVYPNGNSQHCGAKLAYNSFRKLWDCVHLRQNGADNPHQVDYLIGACFAIRKAVFEAVGGFSVDYLVGNSEDLDLCEKVRASGRQIWYLPKTTLIHEDHQSFKSLASGKWQDRLILYNAALFAAKWKSQTPEA